MNIAVESPSFVDAVRDWEWDFGDIYAWAVDTIKFHIETTGPLGWIVLAGVIIVILLNLDLTKHTTELILSSLVRSLVNTVMFVLVAIFGATALNLKNHIVARARALLRWVRQVFSSST